MFRFIVRRLLQMVLTFFGATFVVYALMFAVQDDPIQALVGERPITDSQRTALTARYHGDEAAAGFLREPALEADRVRVIRADHALGFWRTWWAGEADKK